MRIEWRGLLLAAALLVASATAGQAQAQAAGCCAASGTGAQGGGMAGMMARHDSLDRVLAGKMAAMNAARGNQKVEAMAAVINELVSQRAAMRAMMMQHRQGGMGGNGGMGMGGMQGQGMHGGMGMGDGGKGMGECPMMKQAPPDSAGAKPGD